jgi:hypothetical protein
MDIGRPSAGIAALSEITGVWRHKFLGLFFYPEDRSLIFNRNLDERLPDYTVSYPRHLCQKLEFWNFVFCEFM